MYPRLLQLIINNQFSEIEKEGENLDMKSLGSTTFGLMKQNRKGKYFFEGKYPLVKFGMFAELKDASESSDSSDHLESEDNVVTV